MRTKYQTFLFLLLMAFAFIGAGARPMMRGFPLGSVVTVDRDLGIISVDLGTRDYVLKGLTFAVVDKGGHQVALVRANELYNDLFWSDKLQPGQLNAVSAGMQVRWLFTPETSALLDARKKDTVEAYRYFISRFPASPYVPELIRSIPDEKLRELNPDYYSAHKSYTKDSFEAVIKKYPGSGFAAAAKDEIKAIDAYDAEQEKVREERKRRAAEAEIERKKQEAVEEKIRQSKESAQKREALGKLKNNSSDTVRFVFKEPTDVPPTTVLPGSSADMRLYTGNYSYEVYKVEEEKFGINLDDKQQQPLKSGTIDIEFDFWEVSYP
jgi:hypothetical protein